MDQKVRPPWCPHHDDCKTLLCVSDQMVCSGRLHVPQDHGADKNTHRLCLNGAGDDGGVFDLQVNVTDLWWFGCVFAAIREDVYKD